MFDNVVSGVVAFWLYVFLLTQDLSGYVPANTEQYFVHPIEQKVELQNLPTGPPNQGGSFEHVPLFYSFIKLYEKLDQRMLL